MLFIRGISVFPLMSLVLYNHPVVHALTDPICEPSVLEDLRGEIESELSKRLDALIGPEILRDAIKYSVLNSGKLLRPALTLLSCEAAGGDFAKPCVVICGHRSIIFQVR